MIYGIGVDLCGISRMKCISNKSSFIKKYFSVLERNYISEKGTGADQTIAGMFAAKEAFVKAMGTGFVNANLAEVEILHDKMGKPYYNLQGWAKQMIDQKNVSKVFLSISHEGDFAIAYALAEVDEKKVR